MIFYLIEYFAMQNKKIKNGTVGDPSNEKANNLLNVLLQTSDNEQGNFEINLDLDNKKIGSFLKSMRLIKLMTLMDIQNTTNISYQQIKKYEENKSRISVNNLELILGALGLSCTLHITNNQSSEDKGGN
jgi:hypothetical protein